MAWISCNVLAMSTNPKLHVCCLLSLQRLRQYRQVAHWSEIAGIILIRAWLFNQRGYVRILERRGYITCSQPVTMIVAVAQKLSKNLAVITAFYTLA